MTSFIYRMPDLVFVYPSDTTSLYTFGFKRKWLTLLKSFFSSMVKGVLSTGPVAVDRVKTGAGLGNAPGFKLAMNAACCSAAAVIRVWIISMNVCNCAA